MTKARIGGFTIIELMIGLVIAGLLLVLAMPSYTLWIADAQIRNAAESIASGLRYAQTEAIKRDSQVAFTIDPTTGTGGWTATLVIDGSTLQTGAFREGANMVTFAPIPPASTTVTFTGLGQIGPNAAGATMTEIRLDTSTGSAGARKLNVLVGGGASAVAGQGSRTGIKICDPQANIKFGNNDPKACPT
jgi:prepilin-type N-terminal cleavage/methylation domain-containing protein